MKKQYNAEQATGQGLMEQAGPKKGKVSDDYELSPQATQEVEAILTTALKVIHNKSQQEKIVQGLQATQPPQRAIADEANRIFRMMELGGSQEGKTFNEISMTYAAFFIVSELVAIGEAAGLFELSEDEQAAAVQLAIQEYFEEGVKEGRVDPVALQRDLDPMMEAADPEAYKKGLQEAQQQGLGGAV